MLRALSLAAVLALLLPSCASAPDRDRGTDEFRVGIEDSPSTLDPRYASDAHGSRILPLLFHGLLAQRPSGEYEPDLAERWERPDPTTHVFRLRPGVRFHDGSLLSARDVVATYRYVVDPAHGCPAGSSLSMISSVEAPDERTVVFRLKEPFASFPAQLTVGVLPAALASKPDLGDAVVGTGPYRLSSFKVGEEVILSAFAEHFGGPPRLPRLRFRVVSNGTTRLLEAETGGLHLLQNAVPPYAVKFLRRRPDVRVIAAPGSSYQYLAFNLEDPILRDVRVRRAVAHAIDRGRLIAFALEGLGRPATGLFPPEHWAHYPGTPAYDYDPGRAAALLDEAGYPDPDGPGPRPRFRLSYKTSMDKTANEVARVIAEDLGRVGIAVEIRSFEWGTFFSDVKAGNFQLISLRWIGMSDPDAVHFIFHSSSVPPAGGNRGRYRSAEADRLIERSRRELDPALRRELLYAIQELVARDCVYASLWWLDNVVVLRKGFEGFRALPGGEYTSLAEVRREGGG
ncbi:MAG: ABC transporter substrate-binding protein [Deltaproteobacteria bacterium]|nr:ABC transporter substrate-binding protein [Deltaproteobacteria bacterium]